MMNRPRQTSNGLDTLKLLRSKLDSASSLEVIHGDGRLFNAHFTFNPPAQTEEVDELKRSLHVPLPIAYQQFLLQYSGAVLYYDDEYGQWGVKLYGTADFLPTNIRYWNMYEDEWPTSYLVFAESFGDADILILDTAQFVNEKDCQVIDGDRGYPLRMWKSAAQSFGDWLDRLVIAQGVKYWRWR